MKLVLDKWHPDILKGYFIITATKKECKTKIGGPGRATPLEIAAHYHNEAVTYVLPI